MTSVTALLLQAAISLLLFVQAHPSLDASLREQAIEVANRAITVATHQLDSGIVAGENPEIPPIPGPDIPLPVITSVNGKGGFGTGDSNSIFGEHFDEVTLVYLQRTAGVGIRGENSTESIYLKHTIVNDARIDVVVPDWLAKDAYYLYVQNPAGASAPYFVGTIGTSVKGGAVVMVVYPNGGEQLDNSGAKDSGLIANIKWTSAYTNNVPINVGLVDADDQIVKWIGTGVRDMGSFSWKYDSSIPNGKYKIIVSTDDKGPTATDTSDAYFTLTGNTESPSITVTSPNGGEVYERGTPIRVTWSQNYQDEDLFIHLFNNTTGTEYYEAPLSGGIGKNTETLPAEAANVPLGEYRITICDEGTPNPSVTFKPLCDSSDTSFTIVDDPSIE
ncbi:hypothetical protein HY416_01535 [Candidatus Kaiserbacteria bacterium]|nr:hypothetical protein [Candidatus Kaiserbacteria bacterium]